MRVVLILALTSLAACTDFPDLEDRVAAASRDAAYPTLQPLAPVLEKTAAVNSTSQITPASVATMNADIATLQDRAAALRGPVIDSATLAQMRGGVAVPAAIR